MAQFVSGPRPLGACAAALAMLLVLTAPAGASSGDAWAEMRRAVEAACLKAARAHLPKPVAQVDPFGSERFGLALIRGTPKGGSKPVQMICVYDKAGGAVELGSELPLR